MYLTNYHFYNPKNHLYSKPVKGLQCCWVGYRFAFNGKERDNETYGEGNAYDFGARIQDPRLGRWLSVDPLMAKYSGISPYNFTFNNPIIFTDPDGKDSRLTIKEGSGSTPTSITIESTIHLYGPNAKELVSKISGFSAEGTVVKDGKTYLVKIDIKIVYNEKLNEQCAATNFNPSKEPPPAMEFYGVGDNTNKVIAGDNVMYVNDKLILHGNAQTAQGAGFGWIRNINENSLIHEIGHQIGFGERYKVNPEIPFGVSDPGVGSDYMNGDAEKNEFKGFHFYDIVDFAKVTKSGVVINPQIDNTGGVIDTNHKAESEKSIVAKNACVSNFRTKKHPANSKPSNSKPASKPASKPKKSR